MRIGAINRFSTTDYPGFPSAVIYLQGCNMRCVYCRSPELVDPRCFGPAIPEEDALSFLKGARERLKGVVVTGGEPTVHADLPAFLNRIKALGYQVKLETNGTHPEMLRMLIGEGLVDYVAMDVKAPLANYAQITGKRISPELIRTSIWLVKNSGIGHEFCTTVVPGLHTVRELRAIGDAVHGAERFVVQDFISDNPMRGDLRGRPTFAQKPLRDLGNYMRRRVTHYEIRNSEEATQMPVGKRRPPPIPEYAMLNGTV